MRGNGEKYPENADRRGVFQRGGLAPLERNAPADLGVRRGERRDLDEGGNDAVILQYDLLGLDEVGDVAEEVHAACVVATTVAVDAAARDEEQRKGGLFDGDGGNDRDKAEDGGGNEVT